MVQPIFQEDSDVRTAQNTRLVSDHLRKDFLPDLGHLHPVRFRVPVMFLMKTIVKEYPVIKAVIGTHRVGVIIARPSAVMQEIRVSIYEHPAQII